MRINDEILKYWKCSECENGNHRFIRYNDSTLICKKCGRFAKMGYLKKEGDV